MKLDRRSPVIFTLLTDLLLRLLDHMSARR